MLVRIREMNRIRDEKYEKSRKTEKNDNERKRKLKIIR